MAKGVTNRSGSDSCTQPERDRGNSSRDQEPGGPGSPAPKALESGRTNRPKKARPGPRDSPEASTSGSSHSNQKENQPTLRQQGLASRDLGSRKRKTERFSIPMLSEE